jgi:hypothetical protein
MSKRNCAPDLVVVRHTAIWQSDSGANAIGWPHQERLELSYNCRLGTAVIVAQNFRTRLVFIIGGDMEFGQWPRKAIPLIRNLSEMQLV